MKEVALGNASFSRRTSRNRKDDPSTVQGIRETRRVAGKKNRQDSRSKRSRAFTFIAFSPVVCIIGAYKPVYIQYTSHYTYSLSLWPSVSISNLVFNVDSANLRYTYNNFRSGLQERKLPIPFTIIMYSAHSGRVRNF